MDPPYLAEYWKAPCFKNHNLYIQFSATNLPAKDCILQGGKSDPFFQLRKARGVVSSNHGSFLFKVPKAGEYMGEQEQLPVYDGKQHVIKNTLNPKWTAIEISNLSSGNIRDEILIDFWDYDWDKSNDFMGFIMTCVHELFQKHARNESIPLLPGKPGHKWSGHLSVDHIELVSKCGKFSQLVGAFRREFRNIKHAGNGVADLERVRQWMADKLSLAILSLECGDPATTSEAVRRLTNLTATPASFAKQWHANNDRKISWEEFWSVCRFDILSGVLPSEDLHMAAIKGDTALPPNTNQTIDHFLRYFQAPAEPVNWRAHRDAKYFRNHTLFIQFSATDLPNKGYFLGGGSKADPYIQLRKGHGVVETSHGCISFVPPTPGQYMGEQEQLPVYDGRPVHAKSTLAPRWITVEIPKLSRLCDEGNIQQPILIDVWDYNWGQFMGFALASLVDLLEAFATSRSIPLLPGRPGHKWGGGLHVEQIEIIGRGSKYFQLVETVRGLFKSLDGADGKGGVQPETARQAVASKLSTAISEFKVSGDLEARSAEAERRLGEITRTATEFARKCDINLDGRIAWEEFWTVVRFGVLAPLLPAEELRMAAVEGDGALSPSTAHLLDRLTTLLSP